MSHNLAKQMAIICYGCKDMAWTDHIEHESEAWYVTYRFAHFCFIPLFPCGRGKLLQKSTGSGYKIAHTCSTLMKNWAYSCPCCCGGLCTEDGPVASDADRARYIQIINGARAISEPGRNQCPNGHPLTAFQVPSDVLCCDACGNKISQGATLYGCRTCDYDECESCHGEATPEASTAPSQVDTESEGESVVTMEASTESSPADVEFGIPTVEKSQTSTAPAQTEM